MVFLLRQVDSSSSFCACWCSVCSPPYSLSRLPQRLLDPTLPVRGKRERNTSVSYASLTSSSSFRSYLVFDDGGVCDRCRFPHSATADGRICGLGVLGLICEKLCRSTKKRSQKSKELEAEERRKHKRRIEAKQVEGVFPLLPNYLPSNSTTLTSILRIPFSELTFFSLIVCCNERISESAIHLRKLFRCYSSRKRMCNLNR